MKNVSTEEVDRLRRLIRYCPDEGRFWWNTRTEADFSAMGRHGVSNKCRAANCRKWNAAWAGAECFIQDNGRGYLVGMVTGKNYQAHRLAWALHYGEWPKGHIDHINRVRTDNRISNLRLASPSENRANTTANGGMYSSLKGVSFHKGNGRWISSIRFNGRRQHLGYFDTPEAAAEAYKAASLERHASFSIFAAPA